jgi:hypothetical protein
VCVSARDRAVFFDCLCGEQQVYFFGSKKLDVLETLNFFLKKRMLFSNFVATIRADLDAIRDDLGEFVSTVKTDTTAMLGLDEENGGGEGIGNASAGGKHLQWEEEMWDNPELLCEDPESDDWKRFEASSQVKDEEVEMLLSGGVSEIIPELYRELVPSRTTHADFFKRLIFHRNRLNQVVRTKMQELVMDEEETRWEDDSVGDEIASPSPKTPAPQDEEKIVSKMDDNGEELTKIKSELAVYKTEMAKLQAYVMQLEKELKLSEEKRTELQQKLQEVTSDELPHKKASLFAPSVVVEKTPIIALMGDDVESVPVTPPSTSWEALPTPSSSSSNEEPIVVLSKTAEEEEEEDDWE